MDKNLLFVAVAAVLVYVWMKPPQQQEWIIN